MRVSLLARRQYRNFFTDFTRDEIQYINKEEYRFDGSFKNIQTSNKSDYFIMLLCYLPASS